MKTLGLLIIASMFAFVANAKVLTVSNYINAPAQFTDAQVAIDSAQVGDTVYIHGSPNSYGSVTTNKRLTFIGAGYNAQNHFKFSTTINITLGIGSDGFGNPNSNSSGSHVIGIKGTVYGYGTSGTDGQPVNNVIVERINGSINFYDYKLTSGWVIKNSILSNVSGGGNYNLKDIVISNNVITGQIQYFQATSIAVNNNLFINSSGYVFYYCKYINVSNNIFYGKALDNSATDFCSFSNNIAIGGEITTFQTKNHTGGGNLVETNPEFNLVEGTSFSYTDNYTLKSTSPAIDAGTDGTDIGLSGGAYPMLLKADGTFDFSGMPPLPLITKMTIHNVSVPVDGTLQVEIHARKQN